MFLSIVILLVTLLFVWDYLTKKRKNEILKHMPGPKALPLVGNALMYRGQSPEEIFDFISTNRRKYGPLYRVWVLRQLAVFSCNPVDVEVILSSPTHITKNNLYELLHAWLGTGLLMSTGKKWHTRRKIITPTFHFKILEHFVDIFDQQSAVMAKKLYEYADGQTVVNVFPFVCLAALDIIAETSMGTKINAQMNPDIPYVQAVYAVTNITARRFINVWRRVDWIFRLTAPAEAQRLEESIKTMHDFTEKIIMERRQALEQSIAAGTYKSLDQQMVEEHDVGQKQRMALLDVLLQASVAGQPLSNEDIREEVDTFMFEGHDTTTSGISFCLYMISRHAAVQQRAFQEIRDVFGDDKQRPANYRDLSELKYLECVIKESLRLYPPVPMIGRYFEEDVDINGRLIPAGTNYTVGIFTMLRDPDYFPDPDTFNPDRFYKEDTAKLHPYAYIPFSAGPRNCIGQKFAMLELKSTISKVLRHFELLPLGPAVRPMMNLVLRSANGNNLGLKPRNY